MTLAVLDVDGVLRAEAVRAADLRAQASRAVVLRSGTSRAVLLHAEASQAVVPAVAVAVLDVDGVLRAEAVRAADLRTQASRAVVLRSGASRAVVLHAGASQAVVPVVAVAVLDVDGVLRAEDVRAADLHAEVAQASQVHLHAEASRAVFRAVAVDFVGVDGAPLVEAVVHYAEVALVVVWACTSSADSTDEHHHQCEGQDPPGDGSSSCLQRMQAGCCSPSWDPRYRSHRADWVWRRACS